MVTPSLRHKLESLATQAGAENDGHGNRVAAMIPTIMAAAGLVDRDVWPIVIGARLHDIGKRMVPPDILFAQRALQHYEREIIANHPEDGLAIVKEALGHVPQVIATCINDHHEHWDGSGYPGNLRGEAIPLPARLVAIVDVIDALASPRAYKAGLSAAVIRNVLVRGRGKLFDPVLLDAVLENYDAILAARASVAPPPRTSASVVGGQPGGTP